MTDANENRILYALFLMSRETLPIDAERLGEVTGLSATEAAKALIGLERGGLVDASRARLTMLGLAKAVSAGSDLGGTGLNMEAARRPVDEAPVGIAADSFWPDAQEAIL